MCITTQKRTVTFHGFKKTHTYTQNVSTRLETNPAKRSMTVQINNYMLAFGNSSGHAWAAGKVRTEPPNSSFTRVLITQ